MTVSTVLRGWNFDAAALPEQLQLEELPTEDEELLEYLLECDIRDFGLPILRDIPSSTRNIPKDIVLQVKRVKNVSVPESSLKSETVDTSGKAVYRYYFTDGHTSISAVAYDGNFRLKRDSKILFHKECSMENGFLIMSPKYTTVLGGGYEPNVERKRQLDTLGEESNISRAAPKFADLMKNPGKVQKTFHQNIDKNSLDEAVPKSNNMPEQKSDRNREEAKREPRPKEQKSAARKEDHGSDVNARPPAKRAGPSKGRGEFRYNANDEQAPRMVYEDYEHSTNTNLTFTRSGGNRPAKPAETRGNNPRHGRGNSERRPNTEPRDHREHKNKHDTHSRRGYEGSNYGQRGQRREGGSFGRGRGRGRGASQSTRDGNQYQQNYFMAAQPQFNAMSEFDFPTLGDAVSGMSLH